MQIGQFCQQRMSRLASCLQKRLEMRSTEFEEPEDLEEPKQTRSTEIEEPEDLRGTKENLVNSEKNVGSSNSA